MSFRDRYGYDKKKAEDGTWVDKGDDFFVLLRRLNAKPVKDLNQKLLKPHAHLTRGGKQLPVDLQDSLNRKLISQVVLLDWKGSGAPTDASGKTLIYTPEVGEAQFKEFPDFLEEIVEDASNLENFRTEELKEIEGNS